MSVSHFICIYIPGADPSAGGANFGGWVGLTIEAFLAATFKHAFQRCDKSYLKNYSS